MKHGIRRFPGLWRATRLGRRWYYARYDAYPDWRAILATKQPLWSSARRAARGGPRVLMASAIGSYAHAVTLESALVGGAHAARCRGARAALRRHDDGMRRV